MDGNFSLKKLDLKSGGGGDHGTSADLPAAYYRDAIPSVVMTSQLLRLSKEVSVL